MTYPKKHPLIVMNSVDSRTLEKIQKREQLKQLLVTKFKTKYGVKGTLNEQTKLIQSEVDNMLNNDNINVVTLNQLDKKLKEELGQTLSVNKGQENLQQESEPIKRTDSPNSIRSNLQSQRSKGLQDAAKQLLKSTSQLSLKHNENRSTYFSNSPGKRLALQDELWCEIVKYDYQQYQKEQEDLKKKRAEQREQLKSDLAKQVAEKKKEKQDYQKDLEQYAQYQRGQLRKEQEKELQRQKELVERMKVEAQIRQEQLQENQERKITEQKNTKEYEEQLKKRMKQELVDEEVKQKKKIMTFRQQCAEQLEENKRLKEIQRLKELEDEKKGPRGDDLLNQLYEEKKHVSYQKRERNDKVVSLLSNKLAQGESQMRKNQEEQAIYNYVKNKEREDKLDEEKRLKSKRLRELEMKRILDIQLQERSDKKRLNRYQEDFEAKQIKKDVDDYNCNENNKKQKYDQTIKDFQQKLVEQIEEKRLPHDEITPELIMNRQVLDQIKGIQV